LIVSALQIAAGMVAALRYGTLAALASSGAIIGGDNGSFTAAVAAAR
jgi:hypothetical protein